MVTDTAICVASCIMEKNVHMDVLVADDRDEVWRRRRLSAHAVPCQATHSLTRIYLTRYYEHAVACKGNLTD